MSLPLASPGLSSTPSRKSLSTRNRIACDKLDTVISISGSKRFRNKLVLAANGLCSALLGCGGGFLNILLGRVDRAEDVVRDCSISFSSVIIFGCGGGLDDKTSGSSSVPELDPSVGSTGSSLDCTVVGRSPAEPL